MHAAGLMQRLHRLGEPQRPGHGLGRVERACLELASQRGAGHVLGDRDAARGGNDDALGKRLRIDVAHDLDHAREVTVLDAFCRFERREPPRLHGHGDDTTTGVAFGREPATRPLTGAQKPSESESSSER